MPKLRIDCYRELTLSITLFHHMVWNLLADCAAIHSLLDINPFLKSRHRLIQPLMIKANYKPQLILLQYKLTCDRLVEISVFNMKISKSDCRFWMYVKVPHLTDCIYSQYMMLQHINLKDSYHFALYKKCLIVVCSCTSMLVYNLPT